jgi:hypothetical protein
MYSCLVLFGPIATDRAYYAGESIVLEERDAVVLAGYGLVEILSPVKPIFFTL